MITLTIALAIAVPNPSSIEAPRRAFAICLKTFETKSLQEKLAATAYADSVKTACQSEAAALTQALVAFDMAMGTKRAAAAANAERDLADYRLTSEERYRDILGN